MENLLTTGQIARNLKCPLWKIQYLINSRDIEPDCRAGQLRMYSPEILPMLRKELKTIKTGRKKRQPVDKVQALSSQLRSAIGLITQEGGKVIGATDG